MPCFIVHGSRVYQYRSKNKWKESWLSLDENGSLNWKRKDAFLPLASVWLIDVIGKIKIGDAWREASTNEDANATKPFFMSIPMRSNRPAVKFAFLCGPDLELWLAAFAKAIKAEPLYKSVKAQHAARIAAKNAISEEAVEELLGYKELVAFYKAVWQAFLDARSGKTPPNTAFIEERLFHNVDVIEERDQLQKRAMGAKTTIPHSDDSAKDNSRLSDPTTANGQHRAKSKQKSGDAVVHLTNGNGTLIRHANGNGVYSNQPLKNGHAKAEGNGQMDKVPVEALVKTSLTNRSTDQGLITQVGKARLEFYGGEELKAPAYEEDPDRFITRIHIDHYVHQCSEAGNCVMRL